MKKNIFGLVLLIVGFFTINLSFCMEQNNAKIILKNNTMRRSLIWGVHGYSLDLTLNLNYKQAIKFPERETSSDGRTIKFTLIPDQELDTGIDLNNIKSIEIDTEKSIRVAKATLKIESHELYQKTQKISGNKDIKIIFNVKTTGLAYITKTATIVFDVQGVDKQKLQPEEEEEEAEEIEISEQFETKAPDRFSALLSGPQRAEAEKLWNTSDIVSQSKAAWIILGLPGSYSQKDAVSQNRLAERNKKRLIAKWHPDKHPENVTFATEVTKLITEAYYKLYPKEIVLTPDDETGKK